MNNNPSTKSLNPEYEMVRQEIEQKMSLHNSLLMFTITTTVAILAIAAGSKNSSPFLYLLPFCVIIPMSSRIAYYRKAMAKLSAYLIVYCEADDNSIKWETRNLSFGEHLHSKNGKFVLNYYECLILSIICYILFLCNYLPTDTSLDILEIFNCAWPIVLIILEYRITAKINNLNNDRVNLIKIWDAIKKTSGESTYYDYIAFQNDSSVCEVPLFTQYANRIGVFLTDEELGLKGNHRLSNSLDIFLVQAVVTFLYLLGQDCAIAFFPKNNFIVSVVSPISYCIMLFITAVLFRLLVVPRKYGFNEDSYPILFQIHLLCIALSFLVWKQYYAASLIFTLYIGFALSQADVIQCKSASKIIEHLLEPYKKAKLSFFDCTKHFVMDFIILSGVFWAHGKEKALLMGTIAVLVIYYTLNRIRKEIAKAFCNATFLNTDKSLTFLVLNIGHQNVVYHQLLQTIEFCERDKSTDSSELPPNFYDLIVVINTLHTKESYRRYFDKIEGSLKPGGTIIDPSILKYSKRQSVFFSLLGIPNPFAKKYNLNQYKSIISNWK